MKANIIITSIIAILCSSTAAVGDSDYVQTECSESTIHISSLINDQGEICSEVDRIGKIDLSGYDLMINDCGVPVASPIPMPSTCDWNTYGGIRNGVDGSVYTMTMGPDGLVYVGGKFSLAADVPANNIAAYDPSTDTWSSLGSGDENGVSGPVHSISFDKQGHVYVGGDFIFAGSVFVRYITKWDGSSWSAFADGNMTGLTDDVYAVAIDTAGDIYAGGRFQQSGNFLGKRIAKYDISTSTWLTLQMGTDVNDNGVDANVEAIDIDTLTNEVYVGGRFTMAAGISANYIAKWTDDTQTWSTVGDNDFDAYVQAIKIDYTSTDAIVYAGGDFLIADGNTVNRIAAWDGTDWTGFDDGTIPAAPGVGAPVEAIDVDAGGNVYIAGNFFFVGDNLIAKRVVKWDTLTNNWITLGTGTENGFDNAIYGIAVDDSDNVYAGGFFPEFAGTEKINKIAKWNGTVWSGMGNDMGNGANGNIRDMVIDNQGNIYATGSFSTVGNVEADNIAYWNGTTWSALGDGIDGDGITLAYDAINDDVYVGGNFFSAGGNNSIEKLAKWDGSTWTGVGSSNPNSTVSDIHFLSSSEIYIGGSFTSIGGVAANYIAKWDGISWNPLGLGVNHFVDVIEAGFQSGEIIVGGLFDEAGGATANKIAQWDGSSWSTFGFGFSSLVRAIEITDSGDLYAGGDFRETGTTFLLNVAQWDGTEWQALGIAPQNGVNGNVFDMESDAQGNLYVGGIFNIAGTVEANHLAIWDGTVWGPLDTNTPNGANDIVYSMQFDDNTTLHMCGEFSTVGGVVSSKIASYTVGTAPVAVCQDIIIELDATGNASITVADIDNGSSAQCGIMDISIDVSEFTCSDVGIQMIELTVTDQNNNIATCMAEVTVLDVFGICCPSSLFLEDTPILDGTYTATNIVECDTLIDANSTVIFQSGNHILMHPKFEVEAGAVFEAKIGPCN